MAKKKKSENAKTTRRKTVYDLVGERRPHIRRDMDPIDDILLEEERELAREHKRLRLEQIVEKRRREVEKMRNGGIDSGPLPSNQDFLNMAKFLADLSPEEAARVRNAYSFLKLAEKGGGSGMNMLPMLVNYAKQNPGASENQMINYLKLMDSQLLKGLELAKAMNPKTGKSDANEIVNYLKLMDSQLLKGIEISKAVNPNPVQSEDSAIKFLQLMKELVIEGVRNPLLQAIKESQPQPGVLDQLLTNPVLFTQMKEIGIFGGGESRTGSTNYDLEIEKLRREGTLEIKKLDLDWRKALLESEAKDRRSDNVMAALAPLSAIVAGPVTQRMRQFGRQQASAHNPAGMPPRAMPNTNNILIRCSCGYQGPMSFQEPPPDRVNCPSCGLELNVGGIPDASGNPEERYTGT